MKQRKKILIATATMTVGGLCSYLISVAAGLKDRGWSVHLVVTNSRSNLFDSLAGDFTCHDLSTIPLSREKVAAASHLINQSAPDILLLNHCSLMHYALPLLSSKTKPIAVLHSDDPKFYKIDTLFSNRIFRWIAPASGLQGHCMSYLSPQRRSRVRIIPHGVREDLFSSEHRSAGDSRNTVAFVGFLGETKGADLLPDIMSRVVESCPDARLSVIGDGPLRLHLEQRFRDNGLRDQCRVIGLLSQEEVARHLRESDIFLLPTKIEGFGLSIVEAMMAGAVPVVSRLPGITEDIVDNGETGILVDPADMAGFARVIVHLLKNPDRLRSLSIAAKKLAVERYSLGKMLDLYESMFAEADDRRSVAARGAFGWASETFREVMKKGVDLTWISNRITGNWK